MSATNKMNRFLKQEEAKIVNIHKTSYLQNGKYIKSLNKKNKQMFTFKLIINIQIKTHLRHYF